MTWVHLPKSPYSPEQVAECGRPKHSGTEWCVTSSGSRIASKCSRLALMMEAFRTHRSGTTSSPSTAVLGVDEWISSLPVSHASHSASPDLSSERTTPRNGWPATARIIREVRPRYVFLENVPGLTTRYLGVVLGDLAACGYDAEWTCLSAAQVGAPHKRDRIWILAADSNRQSVREQPDRFTGGEGAPEFGTDGTERELANAEGPRRARLRDCAESVDGQVRDGQPAHGGGTDHVANPGSPGSHGQRLPFGVSKEFPGTDACGADERIDSHTNSWRCEALWKSDIKPELQSPRGYIAYGFCQPWTAEPDVGRVADGVAKRGHRLKALGNGQVPQCAAEAFRGLMRRMQCGT